MTSRSTTEFGEARSISDGRRSVTSPVLWWILLAVVVVIDILRVPSVLEGLRSKAPDDLVVAIGDETILRAALTVGAYASVAIIALVVGLCALVGGLLERRLFPFSKNLGSLRFGLVFCGTAVIMLTARLLNFFPLTDGLHTGAVILAAVAIALGGSAWFAPRPIEARVWWRGVLLGAIIGVVLCVQ